MKANLFGPPAPAFLLFALLSSTSTVASLELPFQPVETARPIARRQDGTGCITNFYSCANQGAAFNGVCCQFGQTCGLDASNQPACCPANAVCTGTAPATFQTPSPNAQASFVPNAYFSFPYVQTSFANAGQCSQAVSQCSQNYNACTSRLQGLGGGGGGGGVTVVVGATQTVAAGGAAGGVTMPAATATSVCSSLSSVACMGLQGDMCGQNGVTSGGFYFGTGTGNVGPRVTGVVGGLMGVGVGLGLGVMAAL